MKMSNKLLPDRITVYAADVTVHTDLKAQVNGNTIITYHKDGLELIRFPGHQMEPVSSWSPEYGKATEEVH